jgi:hypothetical protein
MVYIPLRVLARVEKAARKYNAMRLVRPKQAEKLRRAIIGIVVSYAAKAARQRAATFLSRDVRFKGWWRNWREAGLEHLENGAMIRWCGFPKDVVFELAEEVAKDPAVASLLPGSRFWKRADVTMRPTCDVLDLVVLSLREIATIGYQHQLCTDMGIHMGLITKYLHRGKKALRAALGRLHAARVGFFEDQELGFAAHHALEAQHGKCPRKGFTIAFALDGTVTAVHTPMDEELKLLYYSNSKHYSGVNTVLLVSPFGTVHAYRCCLPGNCPDSKGAEPIFAWLYDPAVNPHKFGVLVDYGLTSYCSSHPDALPVMRPFMPTKDPACADPYLAAEAARLSRWVCTCRQYNEWTNGSAKRGFPRWLMKGRVEHLEQLKADMATYLMLHNYRVRRCAWSQTRNVYLGHMQDLFGEQGMTWNEVEGTFVAVEERAYPPAQDD